MAITYKQLAELCGVSRATVDRVIHNRGKVNPDVARRVLEAAKQHNFSPNHVGRALALAGNPLKIGVLVHLTRIDVFQTVLSGVRSVRDEISSLGGEIILKEQKEFDADEQIRLLDELVAEGVRGVAVSPAQDIRLRDRLNELSRTNIPVVTFNTELQGLEKLSHIGVDNVSGGRVGAYLMDLLLRGRGGKVLIISGHLTQQSNYQRVDGFVSECGTYFPSIEVIALQLNADDEQSAYDITRKAVEEIPDLAGIFMVSCGHTGTCRALEDCGMSGKIQLIIYDLSQVTKEYLRKGVVQIVIDQDAYEQGSLPPRILFDYLFSGKSPPSDRIISQFRIITRYNVNEHER